ncbi:MAG: helix-turn-helix domain-containing protein [Actinomycetota bacterium]|nr:helix-turn-helix domain-containing protein [Actinomycetota bacterium]
MLVDQQSPATETPVPRLLYTPQEAAQALGISRSSQYALLSQGAVASVRIGGCRRITAAALHAFIETLTTEVSAIDHYPGRADLLRPGYRAAAHRPASRPV